MKDDNQKRERFAGSKESMIVAAMRSLPTACCGLGVEAAHVVPFRIVARPVGAMMGSGL